MPSDSCNSTMAKSMDMTFCCSTLLQPERCLLPYHCTIVQLFWQINHCTQHVNPAHLQQAQAAYGVPTHPLYHTSFLPTEFGKLTLFDGTQQNRRAHSDYHLTRTISKTSHNGANMLECNHWWCKNLNCSYIWFPSLLKNIVSKNF